MEDGKSTKTAPSDQGASLTAVLCTNKHSIECRNSVDFISYLAGVVDHLCDLVLGQTTGRLNHNLVLTTGALILFMKNYKISKGKLSAASTCKGHSENAIIAM
jgi:hypothetical protein